ncbi:MAG: Uma2 family endonuclease [Acidobacteriota bacterium]
MTWASIIENPLLRNLPFKIELNKFGQILMSPASNKHGWLQSKIVIAIARHSSHGEVITECSVDTPDGVKVADVAWASGDFIARFGYETPYPKAPEICVEIISPSNSREEISHKVSLYLTQGAHEVWTVDEDAAVTVHGASGKLAVSELMPGFRL